MSVILLRIDDRLVHGQVVEGWLKSLRVNHVLVASDAVAADETQKALYMLAIPQGIQLTCAPVSEAGASWRSGKWEAGRTLILVSSPQDVVRLVEAGAPVKSVNVGGLHFKTGRIQLLKAISLDEQDVAALRRLAAEGIVLEARPLPLDEPVELVPYLDRWQSDLMGEQPR